jgi:hypothetical protein
MQRKTKNYNYEACVNPNLLNGPLSFALNSKCIGRFSIESKNNRRYIILSLHIVWSIFF